MPKLPVLFLAVLLCGCAADVPRRPPPVATAHSVGKERAPATPRPAATLLEQLAIAAPDADPAVLQLALQSRSCAVQSGAIAADATVGVIDYTRPSTQRRLWIFDMQQPRLLFADYVAHGRASGENFARHFSNDDGSLQSSLGLFRTAETYEGDNGYSLRLDGLEPGVNDHARSRALVMHGAWYVDPLLGLKQGRLGRSLGCPALRPAVAHAVIDTLKDRQVLFAYYPDAHWLATSRFLHCNADPGGT
jgi:L,D-transpeptidase-like protein